MTNFPVTFANDLCDIFVNTKQEKEKGIEMKEGLVLFFAGDLCGARLRGDDHGAAD